MSNERARGQMSWSGALFSFVVAELPNILQNFKEGQEEEALQALAKTYRERRDGQIADRRGEIAENRAKIDARLEERKLAEPEPEPTLSTSAPTTPATSTKLRAR